MANMYFTRRNVYFLLVVLLPLLITIQTSILSGTTSPATKMLLSNVIFFQLMITILLVIFGVNYYLYTKLIVDTHALYASAKILYAFILVAALATSSFIVARLLAAPEPHFLAQLGFMSLAFMMLSVFTFLVIDALYYLYYAFLFRTITAGNNAVYSTEITKSRRKAILAVSLSALMTITGALSAAYPPAIIHHDIYLGKFPCSMNGFKLVQISDTHLGNTFSVARFEEIVRRINDEITPDMVAITGDLFDAKFHSTLLPIVEPLSKIKAQYGTYYVTGNHEYISGSAEDWIRELTNIGIHVLHNTREVVGSSTEGFIVAGIDDISGNRHVTGHGPSLTTALEGYDDTKEVILLAHQPLAITDAVSMNVGLVLSGHTHGGQIWPFGFLVKLVQPYLAGLHTHPNTHTQIYVSRGTGYWGPPIRLFAPAEISFHTLHCKPSV